MEIKVKVHENRKESTLNRAAMFLLGVFVACLIFALFIDALDQWGVYFSFFLNIVAIVLGFKYFKKGSLFRYASWGLLITLVFISLLLIFVLGYLSGNLESIFGA